MVREVVSRPTALQRVLASVLHMITVFLLALYCVLAKSEEPFPLRAANNDGRITDNDNFGASDHPVAGSTLRRELQVVSTDGSCGIDRQGQTVVCAQGFCCSRFGWCGGTEEHCGAGCQPAYGFCFGSCGPAFGQNCTGNTCCSRSGYCGSTEDYCGAGCQPAHGFCYGSCGPSFGQTCPGTTCCSKFNFCGEAVDYCVAGCQGAYGKCADPSLPVPSSYSTSSRSPVFIQTPLTANAWGNVDGSENVGVGITLTSYANGYDGNPGGLWYLQKVGNQYAFREADEALCLDADNAVKAGAQMKQTTCAFTVSTSQLWSARYVRASDKAVQWKSALSGLCLDGGSGAAGVPLRQYSCYASRHSRVNSQLFVAFSKMAPTGSPTGLFFPTSTTVVVPKHLNALSQHASWLTKMDWSADLRKFLVAPKDQAGCSSCWAFAAVGAIEGIYNRLYTSAPASLSEQQLIDCRASSPGICIGGWPLQALDWVATSPKGLAQTKVYGPYTSGTTLQADNCKNQTAGLVRVARYEQVPPYNEKLLRVVVSKQPAIAYMTLTDNFKNWKTWNIFRDAEGQCTVEGQLTHVVAIVGYGTENGTPFWILRNSFGTSWGVGGYARVLRLAGRGICGLTSAPALYPVIARRAGTQCWMPNPCGRGTCRAGSGTSYTCSGCPAGYVVANNTDGTQTCALQNVCSSGSENPCVAGNCINENNGYYHCVCFLGYLPGKKGDGSPTCVVPPSGGTTTPVTYTTQAGDYCYLIATAFGLTLQQLINQNPLKPREPKLCFPLWQNRKLNVANPRRQACKVLYSIQPGDSCFDIEQRFGLPQGSLSSTLNPGLVCDVATLDGLPAGIQPGQQVCIELGEPDALKICDQVHLVTAAEAAAKSCAPLYASLQIDVFTFFELNRGINCVNLYAGQEVCVGYIVDGPGGCSTRSYKWQRGDSCSSVLSKFCGSGPRVRWRRCFPRYPTCLGRGPAVGARVCRKSCRGATGGIVGGCA